jgi:nucleoside-diphosphate-sugar epimerase
MDDKRGDKMSQSKMKRLLVIGATGQIGSELTLALRSKDGGSNVIAAGHQRKPSDKLQNSGPFIYLDVTDKNNVEKIIENYKIDTIYLLATVLSAVGEQNPQLAWDVNMNGLYNILELAREHQILRVFWPSSIAVFGPETPRENTPQDTILIPRTMYGVTKVAGELLCNYYHRHYGLDVRSVRYPGIISSETPPGGGTTDYAVEIFYEAIQQKRYTCFVQKDTILPMMYMPDCIKVAIQIMEADASKIQHHVGYNVTGVSFSAGELAAEIKKHIPEFECTYRPDFRQKIAESWPMSLDDSVAQTEWSWNPDYDLASMTVDMIEKLMKRYSDGTL